MPIPNCLEFVQAAEAFSKTELSFDLLIDVGALYVLAAPAVPETIREEALQQAAKAKVAEVRELVLWWDANVREKTETLKQNAVSRKSGERISEAEAFDKCKFNHRRIAEWRRRLAADDYRGEHWLNSISRRPHCVSPMIEMSLRSDVLGFARCQRDCLTIKRASILWSPLAARRSRVARRPRTDHQRGRPAGEAGRGT
jgi:hypothetical protein